jgi:nucleotide-binding universal stress UspA family protein/hemerythrin-like domain-containing protein
VYRHMLVPIDASRVSTANVVAAVELAKRLKARITFFHATPDWDATGEGALMRVLDPRIHAKKALGETNALLTKAMACAGAAGVPSQGASRICDRPAEAILEAAESQGCDLIVMASRGSQGAGGWLHSTQTERVLRRSPVALLVTRVASMHPLTASEGAVGIIQDEHRSIAVVVQSMRDMATGEAPDLTGLRGLVYYLQGFPERVHHPKEERYLHRRLRERYPACESLLAEVEGQHACERELIDRVSACLAGPVLGGNAAGARSLRDAVNELAELVLSHIGFEEREVLPLARQHLWEDDWCEIAAAFSPNDDARFGDLPADEFKRLFTRIANAIVERPPEPAVH